MLVTALIDIDAAGDVIGDDRGCGCTALIGDVIGDDRGGKPNINDRAADDRGVVDDDWLDEIE